MFVDDDGKESKWGLDKILFKVFIWYLRYY